MAREFSVAARVVVTLFVFVEAIRMWMEWAAGGQTDRLPTISHSLGGASYGGFSPQTAGSRGIPFPTAVK